uniref:S1 motif domain-containing protein n=1 Tax=Haemonchus placei TaxID=6290 RepID=A0A0N4X9M4_HAEPC
MKTRQPQGFCADGIDDEGANRFSAIGDISDFESRFKGTGMILEDVGDVVVVGFIVTKERYDWHP